jgi:PAS domain-containing protein
MNSVTAPVLRLSGTGLWMAGALLIALATLWWGILLIKQIRERHDRVLVGLIGLVATYQGLHLAIEPRGWTWIANVLGLVSCLAAMALVARLVRNHRKQAVALRLAEAREKSMDLSARVELAIMRPKGSDVPQSILESAPMAMFAIGLDGSVSFWNAAAERVLGWSSAEVLGNRMPNLIARSPGGVFGDDPIRLVRKDGAEVEGPVQSVAVRDARGEVSGILTILSSPSS